MSGSEENSVLLPDRFRDPYTFENVISMQDEILRCGCADMSRVEFIEPYSMVSFLLMGRTCLRLKGEKLKLVNIPMHLNQYLHRMDFFTEGIFNVAEPVEQNLMLRRSVASKRLIEITGIPNKERQSVNVISSVIALFRKRAPGILKFWMDESVVDYFVTVISELCQNIFEHSLDTGYLAIQTYKSGNENIARLVISDSGIGMMQSFGSRPDVVYGSGAELIEMALTQPLSSKREFGYGLCQVNTIVERLKGTLFIRSESSSLTALYNKKDKSGKHLFHRNGLAHFDGTQISISLSA